MQQPGIRKPENPEGAVGIESFIAQKEVMKNSLEDLKNEIRNLPKEKKEKLKKIVDDLETTFKKFRALVEHYVGAEERQLREMVKEEVFVDETASALTLIVLEKNHFYDLLKECQELLNYVESGGEIN